MRDRTLLVLLDNFEHIMGAAPIVADLLADSPRLQVLVTTRAPLHLRGEYELDVPPLRLPHPDTAPELEDLRGAEAVRLFEERVRAIKADFSVTRENAELIAQICRRLDGLPVALELAAARIKVLPQEALLAHLDRRLPLLTGGARDLPARQQVVLGAAEAAYPLVDLPGLVPYGSMVDECVASLRKALGQRRFATQFANGRGLETREAVAEALMVANRANTPTRRVADVPVGLTAREREVLRLLAAGQSNPEIASALVLSVKTVERHLANAYAKVGASGRVEAATYVLTHDLL
jgi:DNA-binding CsgD family transcriptional regulator